MTIHPVHVVYRRIEVATHHLCVGARHWHGATDELMDYSLSKAGALNRRCLSCTFILRRVIIGGGLVGRHQKNHYLLIAASVCGADGRNRLTIIDLLLSCPLLVCPLIAEDVE